MKHSIGKYAGYATRVAEDSKRSVYVESDHKGIVRWFCEIRRIPSSREFVLRMLTGATAEEREFAETKYLAQMPDGLWAAWPRCWFKHRAADGTYYWVIHLGRYCDDPLVQLELEMMIDQSRSAVVQ